jgi:hypothetical protein
MLTDRSGVSWLFMFITILGVAAPLAPSGESQSKPSHVKSLDPAPHVKRSRGADPDNPALSSAAARMTLACTHSSGGDAQLHCELQAVSAPVCETSSCASRLYKPLHDYGLAGELTLADCKQPAAPIQRWLAPAPGVASPLSLQFLIASLPEPAKSGQKHEFDRALDAAVRAIESTGYLRANFYLPWSQDAPAAADCAQQVPGLLLFRKATDPRKLLGLLVVAETPTTGPTLAQLQFGLELAAAFPLRAGQVALLAPYFSGSTLPLTQALTDWVQRIPSPLKVMPTSFLVRTGTATGMPFEAVQSLKPLIDIAALTPSVTALLQAYYGFLRKRGEPYAHGVLHGVALLAEEGTGYAGSATDPTSQSLQAQYTLHFPRNVSELRARWEDRRNANAKDVHSPITDLATPLFLRASYDDAPARDQPVSLSDETTISDDLVLTAELETLAEHNVRRVGIIATSIADAVFLARQARLHLPDAQLFLLQSDQLLTHPEQEEVLFGATVVSGYPPANYGADWVYPFFPNDNTVARFSRSAAHGLYNATLALLPSPNPPDLSAYAAPFLLPTEPRAPAVWISAIGHGGMWPLAVQELATADHYTWRLEPSKKTVVCDPKLAIVQPPESWRSGVAAILAVCSILVLGCALAAWGPLPHPFHLFEAFRPHEQLAGTHVEVRRKFGSRSLLTVTFALLYSVLMLVSVLASVPLWAKRLAAPRAACVTFGTDHRDVWVPACVALALCGVLSIAGVLGQAQAPNAGGAAPRTLATWMRGLSMRRAWRPCLVFGAVSLGVPVLVLTLSAAPSSADWLPEQSALAIFYARASALTSRLSPIGPLVLQAAAWFLTASVYLERHRIQAAAWWGPAESPELGKDVIMESARMLLPAEAADHVTALQEALRQPWKSRARRVAVAALAVAPFAAFLLRDPSTIEAPVGSWGLKAIALVSLTLSAINLVGFVGIWVAFRGFLSELAINPPVPLQRLSALVETLEASWVAGVIHKRQVVMARSATLELIDLDRSTPCEQRADLCPTTIESVHWDAKLASLLVPVVAAIDNKSLHDWAARSSGASWRKGMDKLVASQLALVVSYVAQQLRNLLGLMLVNALLTAIAVSWYPLEPRRMLSTMNWFMVVTVLLIALTVFVKTEQDRVLRHLRGKAEGGVLGDREFLSKVFVWIVIPFLAFLASQYPSAAGSVLDWLAPFSASAHS